MRARIGRWGNGLALRIPKHLADALAIGEGTAVAIGMEGGRLVLMPCASAPTPEDLPARITPASLPTREPTTPRSVASSSDVAAPDRGDLVSLSFTPEAGREQAGRRPAIVLSPRAYHQVTPQAVVCPITSRIKGYTFEVVLPPGLPISGAVLADQVESIDRHARSIEIVGRAPPAVLEAISHRLGPLLGF